MKAKIKEALGKISSNNSNRVAHEAPKASYVPQFVEYTKDQVKAMRSNVYTPIKLNVR